MPRPKSKWGDPKPPENLESAPPGSEWIGRRVEWIDDKIWTIVAVEQSDLGDLNTRRYVMERKNVAVQARCTDDYRRGHLV